MAGDTAKAAGEVAKILTNDVYPFLQSNINGGGLKLEEAIKAIVDHLRVVFPKHNVVACRPQHLANLENSTKLHMELKTGFWGTRGIDIYVFTHGTFTLLGDGGYINWCFSGNFVRDPPTSKTIVFKQIE